MFIDALKNRRDFWLENCIVEGDINILNIYERIKEKIKDKNDKNRLKELITKRDDDKGTIVEINIDIHICIDNVEFKGNFILYYISRNIEIIKTIFKNGIVFSNSTFEKDVVFMKSTFENMSIFGNLTFKGRVDFSNAIFKKTEFSRLIFEKETFFNNSIFENVKFLGCIFENDVLFVETEFNGEKLEFKNLIFKKITKFEEISFKLLIFSECIFEYISHFKSKKDNNGFAVFYKCAFGHKEVIIENFPLSKTSFLLTDMREALILCDEEKEEILSHKLLKLKENAEGIYKEACKILKDDLDYKSVLAEYRNLRISIENNRTYVEASELFIYEMALLKEGFDKEIEQIKQNSRIVQKLDNLLSKLKFVDSILDKIKQHIINDETKNLAKYILLLSGKWIIKFYGAISDYGESITKPIAISLILVLFVFPILLPIISSEYLKHFIDSIGLYIYNLAPEPLKNIILHYNELLEQTLRAFFQLKMNINKNHACDELKTLASYEWLIRIISLILLGSLFIAIKRRLERK
ncbi:hypothetical protein JH146_0730 [Methanocaldococcus bathoardescens]|uniref:Pentapeptide repeat-containing protein n=2 Tax=Methanocaldococcus bathoardescens TaxID=1301915 RepID=A0A076LGL4_9EURY|nr:hypothetical protein JH146_0730 [Methanocaldococcus bathoardescens]